MAIIVKISIHIIMEISVIPMKKIIIFIGEKISIFASIFSVIPIEKRYWSQYTAETTPKYKIPKKTSAKIYDGRLVRSTIRIIGILLWFCKFIDRHYTQKIFFSNFSSTTYFWNCSSGFLKNFCQNNILWLQ